MRRRQAERARERECVRVCASERHTIFTGHEVGGVAVPDVHKKSQCVAVRVAVCCSVCCSVLQAHHLHRTWEKVAVQNFEKKEDSVLRCKEKKVTVFQFVALCGGVLHILWCVADFKRETIACCMYCGDFYVGLSVLQYVVVSRMCCGVLQCAL